MKLPSPSQIKHEYPLKFPKKIWEFRQIAANILKRKDPRFIAIVGPCSVHDSKSALEYACKLKLLSMEIEQTFFPVMRIFFEKPRTKLGWKGLLYDPHLDGSNDLAEGIRQSRKLLLNIAELGIPAASELLEPMLLPYFDDLIVWGLIGARTSASQPHRQMASGVQFPIGFKNCLNGDIETAICGILTSRTSHSHLGIDADGHICKVQTEGNSLTHLVLRGSEFHPNYDTASVQKALKLLNDHHLEKQLIIDCSHGNCAKNHNRQLDVFEEVMDQAEKNPAIAGFMLESHLFEGKQNLQSQLNYGISITDACIGWEKTQNLLRSRSLKAKPQELSLLSEKIEMSLT